MTHTPSVGTETYVILTLPCEGTCVLLSNAFKGNIMWRHNVRIERRNGMLAGVINTLTPMHKDAIIKGE